jgi:hypothetical protein
MKKQNIENLVIQIIQKGSSATNDLIEKISDSRPGSTKQGVYRVLRKLKKEEKVVIHGKLVSLNLHWVKKQEEFFSLAQYFYSDKFGASSGFINIDEGDKVIYFFKNLNLLDSFLSHAFHIFTEITEPEIPFYVYNPHEWFYYARRESEESLVQALEKRGKQVFILSTHSEKLDRDLKKIYQGDLFQYHILLKPLHKKNNYYFAIFDNYLVEFFLDEEIVREVDEFYKKTKVFDRSTAKGLADICLKTGKNKVIISKNSRKAEKLKKPFKKYFFLADNGEI